MLTDSVEKINKIIDTGKLTLITIDGINGSGKSTLAKKLLLKKRNIANIDIDDDRYLKKYCDKKKYVECINYKNLSADIKNFIKNNKLIIINAICILEILNRILLKPDLKIYCKRMNENGQWEDTKYFNYKISSKKVFSKLDNDAKIISKLSGNANYNKNNSDLLLHEIIEYHYKFKPDTNCDIIYNWFETE